MTRVDFYVLEASAADDRQRLACRITEKAVKRGHRVFIHTDSPESARYLDDLLWTFHDRSFLPHGLLGRADPGVTPVIIGHGTDAGGEHDVLINLAREIPAFFSSFERVIEPVDKDADNRAAGREHFRFYKDRGYALETNKIDR
ncbi:MAG: DNA polymerase III subunit chi [Pseudomonadota bacterium]